MTLNIDAAEQSIIDQIELPPRPKILIAINQESKKENASFAAISKMIAEDVAIASAVLIIVNSPVFRRPSQISSIDQAVNLLGLKRVLAIVNAVSVRKALKSKYDLEAFWDFGTAVANAGVIIAQRLKKSSLTDDAYTLGLFHDACAPVLMTFYPSYHDFFLAGCAEGWINSIREEKRKYETTHTTLSALMAQEWCLPDQIVNAIYNLHRANDVLSRSSSAEPSTQLLAILKCAREVARIHLYDQHDNPEWTIVKTQVLECLSIDEEDFCSIRDDVLDNFAGV